MKRTWQDREQLIYTNIAPAYRENLKKLRLMALEGLGIGAITPKEWEAIELAIKHIVDTFIGDK